MVSHHAFIIKVELKLRFISSSNLFMSLFSDANTADASQTAEIKYIFSICLNKFHFNQRFAADSRILEHQLSKEKGRDDLTE